MPLIRFKVVKKLNELHRDFRNAEYVKLDVYVPPDT
jgi:hypothetical protein